MRWCRARGSRSFMPLQQLGETPTPAFLPPPPPPASRLAARGRLTPLPALSICFPNRCWCLSSNEHFNAGISLAPLTGKQKA